MARVAVAAFLGLMEVHGAGAEDRYERWHASDHLPENLAIPGVVFGQRWHAGEALRSTHDARDAAFGAPQFLITYFFGEPLETSLEEWNTLADRLHEAGRMFDDRSVRLGGLFAFEHREIAPGLDLSVRALHHRPHTGVYLHLAAATERGEADEARFREVLARPGVAGGIRFASAGAHEYGETRGGRAELYFAAPDADLEPTFAEVPNAEDAVFTGSFAPSVPFRVRGDS